MSRFSGDAFFGLDGLGMPEDEPIEGQAIDLDRDAIEDEQPASQSQSKNKKKKKPKVPTDGAAGGAGTPAALDPELMRRFQAMGGMPDGVDPAMLEQVMRGEVPDLGGAGAEADGAGMPPGMGDFDPELISEMMGVLQGGQRDPAKLRKLMSNPKFSAMMEQFGGGMGGMGGLGGLGGMGGAGGPTRRGRADAQRERLQERLRKKQEESGGFGLSTGQTTATTSVAQGQEDDWTIGVPTAGGGKARAAKKGSNKKKKGGKKK